MLNPRNVDVSRTRAMNRSTGQMQVFVETESPSAREGAERVYASVRADSECLDDGFDPTA